MALPPGRSRPNRAASAADKVFPQTKSEDKGAKAVPPGRAPGTARAAAPGRTVDSGRAASAPGRAAVPATPKARVDAATSRFGSRVAGRGPAETPGRATTTSGREKGPGKGPKAEPRGRAVAASARGRAVANARSASAPGRSAASAGGRALGRSPAARLDLLTTKIDKLKAKQEGAKGLKGKAITARLADLEAKKKAIEAGKATKPVPRGRALGRTRNVASRNISSRNVSSRTAAGGRLQPGVSPVDARSARPRAVGRALGRTAGSTGPARGIGRALGRRAGSASGRRPGFSGRSGLR